MAGHRIDRVNEEMLREMAEIIRTVKDPRVNDGFLSVTRCDVTQDFKYAKIYYSHLGGDADAIRDGLKSASGYIRREVAARLNLRVTPLLSFIRDGSMEHGAKITEILKSLDVKEPEAKDGDGE